MSPAVPPRGESGLALTGPAVVDSSVSRAGTMIPKPLWNCDTKFHVDDGCLNISEERLSRNVG